MLGCGKYVKELRVNNEVYTLKYSIKFSRILLLLDSEFFEKMTVIKKQYSKGNVKSCVQIIFMNVEYRIKE